MRKLFLAAAFLLTLTNYANANTTFGMFQAYQDVSLTGPAFIPDVNLGANLRLTLVHGTCPCTLNNMTNIYPGQFGVVRVINSSVGNEVITLSGSQYGLAVTPAYAPDSGSRTDWLYYVTAEGVVQFYQTIPSDIPPPAASVGFTTVAIDSEFSQPQPNGWFACSGGASGAQWYQGVQGGDSVAAPCSVTGGQPGPSGTSRFNLVTDPLTSKQAMNLNFKLSDVAAGLNYATMQTADDSENAHTPTIPCCVLGKLFPYGFYIEAGYRIVTTPDSINDATGGVQMDFWQAGKGLSPFTNPHGTNMEIDHPEFRGELWFNPGADVNYAGPQLSWGTINWYDGSDGGYFSCVGCTAYTRYPPLFDSRQYHTYGARVTTDGSTGIAYCSYLDGIQIGCHSGSVTNAAQYAELKYAILFVGITCYNPGGPATIQCLNIPISTWYACGSPIGSSACFTTSSAFIEQSENLAFSVSGVTGCAACNKSWFASSFDNGHGANRDWVLHADANDPSYTFPTWFGGTPTGGTVNALSQVDLYIDHVRVWSCASWASGPCNTALATGTP